ncbi:hypothetical protein [Pseudoramibacter porci]|uniref:Uncharacterized protein n=1 Tax=Pseudoramibacter porci TaxID=2606631 RepID=A0A7X2NEG1_9FIRM|nr:hypothetical protein [Pseudoramibacter porci]MSS19062.1 hypothetical protein [Pseudoramibacter porci]
MENKVKNIPKGVLIGESIFDIAYLLFAFTASAVFFSHGTDPVFFWYGWLTLILGAGDAFHLVPRVVHHLCGDNDRVQWWMQLGLLVSSMTMTVFYIILVRIWTLLFDPTSISSVFILFVALFAFIRIVLCAMPQNKWFSGGDMKWSFARNLAFLLLGGLVAFLFASIGNTGGYGLWKMALAIAISFGCYLPVTIWAKTKPAIGALMIPKTMAYIWMIAMGLALLNV